MRTSTAQRLDRVETGNVYPSYDLSRYEEIDTPCRPRFTVRTSRQKKQKLSRLHIFNCIILTVALLSLSIYNNVLVVELGDQLSQYSSRLEMLQNETVLLQSKLESATSLRAVEQYAKTSLGMGPVAEHQVTYMCLGGGDKIQKTNKAPDRTLEQQMKKMVRSGLEYLRIL